MKHTLCLLAIAATLVSAGSRPAARQSPELDMGVMQMVFLRDAEGGVKDSGDLIAGQRTRLAEMLSAGQCALAAEVSGGGDGLKEILVFKTQTREEVDRLVASLPAVKAGLFKAETLAWFAARNFIRKPSGGSSNYVFGLLVRGPNSSSERTPESEKIQKGHMENILRLHGLGKLVLAGPFEDGGERRGVFFFKVASVEEAKALSDTDPAVIAGRLKVELFPITVATGVLD
jgi:uncharacterized protein YciI